MIIVRRTGEHIDTTRLTDGFLKEIDKNVTYGQARGYEQAYIEHYGTRKGTIGEAISPTNQANKYNSFDHSRADPSREDLRGQCFEDAYENKNNQLNDNDNNNGVCRT